MKKGVRYGTVFFLIVATAFISSIATYFYISVLVNDLSKNQAMNSKLNQINDVVTKNYIVNIDPMDGYEKILDGMISGYIQGLGDPYSYYLNSKNYKTSAINIDASFIDIGCRYVFDSATGGVLIDFVRSGSPAQQSGLKIGDIIIEIDGTNVSEVGFKKATQMLLGEEGSIVELNIIRAGEGEILPFLIKHTKFIIQTVEYRMLESQIAYMFINEFTKETLADFTVAYDDVVQKGAKGLIIDVRFNAGGDLNSAVDVADKIMPVGIITSIRSKTTSTPEIKYSDGKSIDMPIIVIQNSYTAGVSEVFAAALRDVMENVVVVGTRTKGVGVAQRDIALTDGTAVRLSVYEYTTPNGERFNKVGLEPNYVSNMDAEKEQHFDELSDEDDDQLVFALQHMKNLLY